ncbi:hypothetical protein DPMN_009331 [Dreissena polymorpha]|uniref:Uncharacterized protein n=1 Tax=Dreissena polymorpha TaxID=45954 RepID=A0A9D4MWQ2_DREPO|nr:hypothetical protein DPMN_009331 [Dreissena polymorpha]
MSTLTLSIQLLFCRPQHRPPSRVPWRTVLHRESCLLTCPIQVSSGEMLSTPGDFRALRLRTASATSALIKYGQTVVLSCWSVIVLKENGVWLKLVVVEVTALSSPPV